MTRFPYRRNKISHQIILVWILISLIGCFGKDRNKGDSVGSLSIPDESHQIILVTTSSWNDFRGILRLYTRTDAGLKAENGGMPVVLGRNGLAWGRGLHENDLPGPQKVEGDGKAPAGIFALGISFGYDHQPPPGSSFPYRQATEYDYFIDDIGSPAYNRWISLADSLSKDPHHYWSSFERMRRNDNLYELGIVVKHNMDPILKGKGSAIFFHMWRGSDQPSAGCTAMSKEHLLKVLRWLDTSKKPLLVQIPEEVLKKGNLTIDR